MSWSNDINFSWELILIQGELINSMRGAVAVDMKLENIGKWDYFFLQLIMSGKTKM